MIAERHAAIHVLARVLRLVSPDEQEDGPSAHEEGVGAVIEVLSAEIPEMQAHLLAVPRRRWQQRRLHRNAVRAVRIGLEVLHSQSPADLSFADTSISEHQDLDVRDMFLALLQIPQVARRLSRQFVKGSDDKTSVGISVIRVPNRKSRSRECRQTSASGRSLTWVL